LPLENRLKGKMKQYKLAFPSCHRHPNQASSNPLLLLEAAIELNTNLSASHCSTLRYTATHCNTLRHTATHCHTLQLTATHCNSLHHTATRYTTLQPTAPHCNTLQHTAAHCNALHHTAAETAFEVDTHCQKSPRDSIRDSKVSSFVFLYGECSIELTFQNSVHISARFPSQQKSHYHVKSKEPFR